MDNQLADFKRFCIQLFLFALIVFIADQIAGRALQWLYFKQNHGFLYKTTYTFNKVNTPVLIIGSSRANHHYYPGIFEDSLKLKCFNSGLDGGHIFYYDAVLKCVLKRYTPKIIVLDLLPQELEYNPEDYDHLSVLLPYYSTHPEIRDLILLRDKYEQIKLFSAIYPFNSLIIPSLTGSLDLHHKGADETKLKGFDPGYNSVLKEKLKAAYYKNDIDTITVNTLQYFIKECSYRKIKLFMVVSPVFINHKNESKSISIAKIMANRYRFKLWDYSKDPYFLKHPELFNDIAHLNPTGAKIFSELIAGSIKSTLKN
jgi:hypothetical protein